VVSLGVVPARLEEKRQKETFIRTDHSVSPNCSRHSAVRVGVIGVGTVGTGTLKAFVEHQREVKRRLGCELELRVVCSRSIHRRDLSWLGRKVERTTDWRAVVGHPEVDIVVELVGEIATARAIARAALQGGKHFVTANKQLVAEYGMELVELSHKAGVSLGIEACVAGGTPVLHAIREGLAGEQFTAVWGILNGTTNFILTEMERGGRTFQQALAEAQQRGYAEPDPTFDVEGYDARYKIAILAMLCFGQPVPVQSIPVEGIRRIGVVDFAYARRLDHTIRLIAAARRLGQRLEVFVRPMLVARDSPLAAVSGTTNAILLEGNKGGQTLITGRGAGGEPTGVAVLSDIVQIARAIAAGSSRLTPFGYTHWRAVRLAAPRDRRAAFYVRLVVRDRPGILATVSSIFARHRINIDSVLQEPSTEKQRLPFVLTLEPSSEDLVLRSAKEINRLPFLTEPPLWMPFAESSQAGDSSGYRQ
jgi:homoserine dehydrogenase